MSPARDDPPDPRKWFEDGLKIVDLQQRHEYFSAGLRRASPREYWAWAWVGIGLVAKARGDQTAVDDAFRRAVVLLPGVAAIIDAHEGGVPAGENGPAPHSAPRPATLRFSPDRVLSEMAGADRANHRATRSMLADPLLLSKEECEYYRTIWGFDPVDDCQPLLEGKFRYNACVPMKDIGVMICARVIWHAKGHCNYIIFGRDTEETFVASTNRLIYAGLTPITPGFDFNIYTPRENLTPEARDLLRRAGNPAVLPPWVHFAALKTYIAAVAEVGLLSLLRQSYPALKEPVDAALNSSPDLHRQFVWSLHAIAPSIAEAIFRDLATEFFSKHPMDLRAWLSFMDKGSSRYEADEFYETEDLEEKLLRESFDEPALIAGFRHSGTLDAAQDCIFSDPEYFAQGQVLASTTPWDLLRLEWEAREAADSEESDRDQYARGGGHFGGIRFEWEIPTVEENKKDGGKSLRRWEAGHHEKPVPPAEVWPRGHFCCYEFPRALLEPCAGREVPPDVRRGRVQQYLNEVLQRYDPSRRKISLRAKEEEDQFDGEDFEDGDLEVDEEIMLEWAREALDQLETDILRPFPADMVKPDGPRVQGPEEDSQRPAWFVPITPEYYLPAGFTPADVTDRIRRGKDDLRRAIILTVPLPIATQAELAAHWDFATRLALVGNPQTDTAIIATLAKDLQPCVRAAATARLRRGEAKIEPLIGEVLDPGEIIWFLAAHPSVYFYFGVTTWDNRNHAYRDWLENHMQEDSGIKGEIGGGYAWAYEEGFFYEYQPDYERGAVVSHLALRGLGNYACGHFPCIYLGPDGWNASGNVLRI